VTALVATAMLPATAFAVEGPPEGPDTRHVMFVGNNWDGTADIIDARTYQRLARINVIPDKDERMVEITTNPVDLAFFLAIREFVGEGNDQFVDDMFTSHDGRLVAVSRPSFADVVGIDLRTQQIVWRFEMEGQRSDHMGVSPDGTKLLVSDSTANKVHELDLVTGQKTGEFESGDSPHENNYSEDGSRIFHASIGRVYTPTDQEALGLVRDTSKGDRFFQVVDANTLQILSRVDMGQKLEEAGYPDMSSAVRPMALSPDERYAYLQVSFHHGFVEYDLQQERVLRVIHLPISDEAAATPREQYLLDSAHHGLAMNEEGTKLCVAGTMSDYAAIVGRADPTQQTIFPVGEKPYWSTNGLAGSCWVSFSGDDKVGVFSYGEERQVADVPVGDHPQRVRLGVVQRAYLPGLPVAAGARDNLRPRIRVRGVPRRCGNRGFRARVIIRDQSALRSARVMVRDRRLRSTRRKTFRVRVPVRSLRTGRHRLRVAAVDEAGNRGRRVVRFRRCVRGAQTPRFTG
jgi:DNA-binding beta-propeller fold protein YncE